MELGVWVARRDRVHALVDAADPETFDRALARRNERRLAPSFPDDDAGADEATELALARYERRWVEGERRAVRAWAAKAPSDPARFVAWFVGLGERGPGQNHPLFPWLAGHAPLDAMRWFLAQEVAGEAGFEDLVALTQIRMPTQPKLELARNYWDEMGRGSEAGMHGPMLARLARELELDPWASGGEGPVIEAVRLSNLLVALAHDRRYAYHAIGALGVVELTAPGRASCVNAGLKRLGFPARTRQYFALHATLDVQHSVTWNREVIVPLVKADPRAATAIAEGALMRLRAGAVCFERYRRELRVDAPESGVNGSAIDGLETVPTVN